MLKRLNGWGPGTPYKSYEEYWKAEILRPLHESYYMLTGEDIGSDFGLNCIETERDNQFVRDRIAEGASIEDFIPDH